MLISAMYKYLIEGCSMGGHSSRFRRQGTDSMPWLSSPANAVNEIRDLRFRAIGRHHNTENPGITLPDNMNKMTIRRTVLRSEEHTSELQSRENLVCRLLLEKKKKKKTE